MSDKVNLEELLRWVEALPDVPGLRADGHEQIIALFDVSQEPFIRQVHVEALVGNDYRVEVLPLYVSAPAVESYEFHYRVGGNSLPPGQGYFVEKETPGVTAARRSRGNVQDMSNLELGAPRPGGVDGAGPVGCLDGAWEWGDAEVRWEYARSVQYREFPDGRPGHREDREIRGIRRWNGARSSTNEGRLVRERAVAPGPGGGGRGAVLHRRGVRTAASCRTTTTTTAIPTAARDTAP